MTESKQKFLQTLQTAGLIHPHAGHEKVVLDALDEFERVILTDVNDRLEKALTPKVPEAEDAHAEEIEDAANQHGQGIALVEEPEEPEVAGSSSEKYAAANFGGTDDPYDFAQYMKDSPHAKAAAETKEPIAETEPAPAGTLQPETAVHDDHKDGPLGAE